MTMNFNNFDDFPKNPPIGTISMIKGKLYIYYGEWIPLEVPKTYNFETIKNAVEEWFCMDIDEEKWDHLKELLDK